MVESSSLSRNTLSLTEEHHKQRSAVRIRPAAPKSIENFGFRCFFVAKYTFRCGSKCGSTAWPTPWPTRGNARKGWKRSGRKSCYSERPFLCFAAFLYFAAGYATVPVVDSFCLLRGCARYLWSCYDGVRPTPCRWLRCWPRRWRRWVRCDDRPPEKNGMVRCSRIKIWRTDPGIHRGCPHGSRRFRISWRASYLRRLWDRWKGNKRLPDNSGAWESKTGIQDSSGLEVWDPWNQELWGSSGELQKIHWIHRREDRIPDYHGFQRTRKKRYYLQK